MIIEKESFFMEKASFFQEKASMIMEKESFFMKKALNLGIEASGFRLRTNGTSIRFIA